MDERVQPRNVGNQGDTMLARGLTYERLLLGGEGQMAVRLWSSGLHGLSMASLPRLRPSCHLLCNFCKILFVYLC